MLETRGNFVQQETVEQDSEASYAEISLLMTDMQASIDSVYIEVQKSKSIKKRWPVRFKQWRQRQKKLQQLVKK